MGARPQPQVITEDALLPRARSMGAASSSTMHVAMQQAPSRAELLASSSSSTPQAVQPGQAAAAAAQPPQLGGAMAVGGGAGLVTTSGMGMAEPTDSDAAGAEGGVMAEGDEGGEEEGKPEAEAGIGLSEEEIAKIPNPCVQCAGS